VDVVSPICVCIDNSVAQLRIEYLTNSIRLSYIVFPTIALKSIASKGTYILIVCVLAKLDISIMQYKGLFLRLLILNKY